MSTDVRLDPPVPHLEHIASTIDGRLENLVRAYTGDTSPEAATIRWLATGWMTARAGLDAVAEAVNDGDDDIDVGELNEIVREGLEVPVEEDRYG